MRGQLTVGYLNDTNLAQVGSQTVALPPGLPQPPTSTSIAGSGLSDHGLYLAAELQALFITTDPWTLGLTLSSAQPFYSVYHTYDNEEYTGDVSLVYRKNLQSIFNIDFKYLNSRYNNIDYQHYWTVSPGWFYLATSNLNFKLDAPVTISPEATSAAKATTVAPILTTHYGLTNSAFLTHTASYSHTFSPAAQYVPMIPTTVSVGHAFSSSTTYGTSIAATNYFPLNFEATLSGSIYWTKYPAEALPPGATNGIIDDRSDTLTSATLEVSNSIIQDYWSVAASFTLSHNSSSGYQGLSSGSTMANYNFDRQYLLLSSTLSY